MSASTYRAFLSYSHAADGLLAPALQSALHRFCKPWYRLRAMRVFRDKTSLAMTPELWPSLEKSLGESEWFLLMASHESAGSQWVRKEIGWWLAHRSSATLLLLLTDGELAWDATAGDFDWARTTAIPRDLAGRYANEPLYVDLRWAKTAAKLSLRHPQFRAAILDIAAPLLGKAKDELDGEDIRQFRRTRIVAWSAVAAITLFAVTAAWEAYTANQRYVEALSRQLAAQAINGLATQLDRSLLLGVAAGRVRDTVEARSSLLHALEFSPMLDRVLASDADATYAVAFSHGPGGRLISAHRNGDVLLWDLKKSPHIAGRLRGTVNPATNQAFPVRCLAIAPDGRTIAAGDNTGGITLSDAADPGKVVRQIADHDGGVNALAFSPDGRWLASASDDSTVVIRPVGPGVQGQPRRVRLEGQLTSVDFDRSGSIVAAASDNGVITLWTLETNGLRSFQGGSRDKIRSIAFSPVDDNVLASADELGTLMLWDLQTMRPSQHQPQAAATGHSLWAVAFSPDGRRLAAAGSDQTVFVWDVKGLRLTKPLKGHAGTVYGLAFSADGEVLASGDSTGRILTWNLAGREFWQVYDDEAWTVAFSPDGRTLAGGGKDGTIRVTDIATGRQVALTGVHREGVSGLAFISSDGSRLASVGPEPPGVVIWELSGVPAHRVIGNREGNRLLVSAPDRTFLLTGTTDGYIIKWDTTLERSIPLGRPHEGNLLSLSIDRSSRAAVSLDDSGLAVLWNPNSLNRREFRAGKRTTSLLLSPDGRVLAAGLETGEVVLRDVASSEDRGETLGSHPAKVKSLTFSDDGELLASGDEDGNIMLWNVRGRQQIGPILSRHGAVVGALAFQPGRQPALLASASDDATVRLWDLSLSSWRERACRTANRDLSRQERQQYLGANQDRVVCSAP